MEEQKMNMTELYQSMIGRERMHQDKVREGSRIAVILPGNQADIMKVGTVAHSVRDSRCMGLTRYDAIGEKYAVAKVCPHQASVMMRSDGSIHLNALVDVEW